MKQSLFIIMLLLVWPFVSVSAQMSTRKDARAVRAALKAWAEKVEADDDITLEELAPYFDELDGILDAMGKLSKADSALVNSDPALADKVSASYSKVKNAEAMWSMAPTDYINGYAFVDLGLSVKWATCNIGASTSADPGDYFAWGDTVAVNKTKNYVYKYIIKDLSERYYGDEQYAMIGDDIGGTPYDVARQLWGAPWRMPTIAEMRELEEKCTWGRYYLDGKRGCLVTGPNGKSIFLADAGTFKNGSLDDDTSGHYWSSTLSDYDLSGEGAMGWILHFNDSTYNAYTSSFRFYGLSVRPVAK